MKLNAFSIKSITKPGRYADGNGLYLLVKPSGAKSWLFRYALENSRRDMGLGALKDVTLAEARKRATESRMLVLDGIDPIANRDTSRAMKLAAQRVVTFGDCLEDFIKSKQAGWKTDKQARDTRACFENHAKEFLSLSVRDIIFDDVVEVLEPLWGAKTETATRLQSRMEAVLGLAKVRGLRGGDNPAAWKGNLCFKFPKRSDVQPVKHFKAMRREDLPDFYAFLSTKDDISYHALRFIILTASRTKPALQAPWDEFDFEKRLWVIPPKRMKRPREHRVPLSSQAIEILSKLRENSENEWVFPSTHFGKHLSGMACIEIMKQHKRPEKVHGFRSTFKDWAAECTDYPNEVSEMALAHEVGDKTEAAYRRGDLLEKRVSIMQDWADFVSSKVK